FYFRLSALREAFEFVAAEAKPGSPGREHVEMIQWRLASCFVPALRSLERLKKVPNWEEFDQEATEIYPWLRDEQDTLRNVLRKYDPQSISRHAFLIAGGMGDNQTKAKQDETHGQEARLAQELGSEVGRLKQIGDPELMARLHAAEKRCK